MRIMRTRIADVLWVVAYAARIFFRELLIGDTRARVQATLHFRQLGLVENILTRFRRTRIKKMISTSYAQSKKGNNPRPKRASPLQRTAYIYSGLPGMTS
jgi:hypothetical protein